jgi:hypothetical protein
MGVDFPEYVVKSLLPIVMGEDFQFDLFMLFEVYFLERLENTVFEYCIDYFGHAGLLFDGFLTVMLGSLTPSIADEVITEAVSMASRSAGFLRYGLVLINDFFIVNRWKATPQAHNRSYPS